MSHFSPPSPLDRILELKDEAEKQKVELTPGVKAYIQTHLEIVQDKLRKGEDVTEDDMKFIDEVKLWVGMPEEIRDVMTSIEIMKPSEVFHEAIKRDITVQQWIDLLHVAESEGKPQEWIDEKFQFRGEKRIKALSLFLDNKYLTHLPESLFVENLYIGDCPSLSSLPQDLLLEGLVMSQDVQPQVHEDAKRMIREGKVLDFLYMDKK